MPVGGQPSKPRTVLTLSRGGIVVGAVTLAGTGVGVGMCESCTPVPQPPIGPEPPVPTATVDAEPPMDDARPEPPPQKHCEFVGPRARSGRRLAGRIVGGKPSEEGAFPFIVAIADSGRRHFCGASVVTDTSVVTAAHCQVQEGDLVLVGSVDLLKTRAIRVAESRIHPSYNSLTFDYDVAIAKLAEPAGVPTVPLATGVTSMDSVAVGWGRTGETEPTTRFMRDVGLPLWQNEDCRKSYPTLTERQRCAGVLGKDACAGDSGSGLLSSNVGSWELIGVTSFGVGCARDGFPGVWTNTVNETIREWIETCK